METTTGGGDMFPSYGNILFGDKYIHNRHPRDIGISTSIPPKGDGRFIVDDVALSNHRVQSCSPITCLPKATINPKF